MVNHNNTSKIARWGACCVAGLMLTAIGSGVVHAVETVPPVSVIRSGVDSAGAVRLTVNKSTLLTTRTPYRRVSVAQPEIADVNPINASDVLLTAKKVGTTQLIIWDDNDHSQVVDVTVGQDLTPLRDQLKATFPDHPIEVVAMGGSVGLRGRVPTLTIAEQAVAMAQPYGENVLNFLEIAGGQQVMLQVRFLEVSRAAVSALGVDLTGTLAGSDATVGVTSSPAPVANPAIALLTSGSFGDFSFEALLEALKRNNLARTLAEPNLIAISGQEASFLAGGEFPVPVPQAAGAGGGSTITIEYKEFGVRLRFVPIVLGDGRIRLKCAPEVSDLDFVNAVSVPGTGGTVPGLKTRKVDTTIELHEGQSFAIAGLLNHKIEATKSRTPLLGDLPVLGTLFRSVRYERNETELVVLVTPRLVEPLNPGQVPPLPGEHWRHPRGIDLMLNGDLGGPEVRKPAEPAKAPKFEGAWGFAPEATTASVVE